MKTVKKYHLSIIIIFIWIGFLCSISFMEAWLKFTASGVTLPIGLSIGKLVFNSLTKVEWVFILIMFFNFYIGNDRYKQLKVLFLVVLGCLTIQSLWILPLLNERANLIIAGKELNVTYHHLYYVILEIIKVLCLLILGIKLLKTQDHGN